MTSAGTTLSIGAYPATYDAAGFAAVSWTAVAEITDLGSFGKTYTEVKHTSLTQRQTKKFKGSYDNGQLQLKMAKLASDAGQQEMLTALASDSSYAFKVVLQDGTHEYFSGKVMSYVNAVGNVDQITGADATIAIDGDVIEV
jgi:hypothetical protein